MDGGRAGVLRTEITPSHDRVTVVGDVDAKVLVKKLAKVGKIAEVLPPSSYGDGKRRDDGVKKQDGDKPLPPQVEEKSGDGRSAADDKAAACEQECTKCALGAAADDKNGGDKEKAPPPKSAEEGNGFGASKWSSDPDHAVAEEVHQFQHYHRAEPAMVVPAYYPPPPTAAPYYGYYAAPPPMIAGGAPAAPAAAVPLRRGLLQRRRHGRLQRHVTIKRQPRTPPVTSTISPILFFLSISHRAVCRAQCNVT
jgi:hypothetical protein